MIQNMISSLATINVDNNTLSFISRL